MSSWGTRLKISWPSSASRFLSINKYYFTSYPPTTSKPNSHRMIQWCSTKLFFLWRILSQNYYKNIVTTSATLGVTQQQTKQGLIPFQTPLATLRGYHRQWISNTSWPRSFWRTSRQRSWPWFKIQTNASWEKIHTFSLPWLPASSWNKTSHRIGLSWTSGYWRRLSSCSPTSTAFRLKTRQE